MSWRQDYKMKCMDAAEALETVHSGDRLWIQSGCGTPSPLVDALVARAPFLQDVEIVHMKTLATPSYTKPEFEGHFPSSRIVSWRERARSRGCGPRRLHADLPQRDRRVV